MFSKYVAGVGIAFINVRLGMLMKNVFRVYQHVCVGVDHVKGVCVQVTSVVFPVGFPRALSG